MSTAPICWGSLSASEFAPYSLAPTQADVTPKQVKTVQVMGLLMLSIHIISNFWWLWKVMAMDEEDVYAFLDSIPWGMKNERADLE